MKSLRHAHLQLSFNSREPIYQQIKAYIVNEIQRGRLLPGVLLPGTRILAQQLKVNRNTIITVYEQLIAEGWLSAHYKSGTRISDTVPVGRQSTPPEHFDISFNQFDFPAIQPLSRRDTDTAFDDGQPDIRQTPLLAEVSRECRRLLQQGNKQLLYHNGTNGHHSLLQELNGMLNNNRGLAVTPANICITHGHQLSVYLTARTLIQPGDHVAVENPGYQPAWQAFTTAGATLHQVPVDENGLDVDQLEALCKEQPLKAVYVTPHHQYPTTVTLSAERRKQLLALSEQYQFVIIEDDYDHEYYFSKENILPIASIAGNGNVIYISTLSNEIPLSFVCGNPAFIKSLSAAYTLMHGQEHLVLELAVANLMKSGELRKYQQLMRGVYKEKMEQVMSIITPATKPSGGLALWIDMDINAEELLQKLQVAGISVVSPYRYYDPLYTGPVGLRIGYASIEVKGLEKLAKVLG
jgi:GntR family transcriptional regulator / MocR family aminotransferase